MVRRGVRKYESKYGKQSSDYERHDETGNA